MSLFGTIAKIGKQVISGTGGGALAAIPVVGTAASLAYGAYQAYQAGKPPPVTPTPGVGFTSAGMAGALVPVGKQLAKRAVGGGFKKGGLNIGTLGKIAAGTIAGEAIYDAAGNLIGYKKKRRRMNYMNYKAAKRATRRIKGARKMLQNIEKQLPKHTVRSRTTRCEPKCR